MTTEKRCDARTLSLIAASSLVTLGVCFMCGASRNENDRSPGVVEGKEFRLLGPDGSLRGSWSVQRDVDSEFDLFDTKGRKRLVLRVGDYPAVKLLSENGEQSVVLLQKEGDGSSVLLFDQKGTKRIYFAATKSASSTMLFDADGHIRVSADCMPDGNARVVVRDSQENEVWRANVPQEVTPKLEKKDK